jgi:hypothetical protein
MAIIVQDKIQITMATVIQAPGTPNIVLNDMAIVLLFKPIAFCGRLQKGV